MYDSVFVSGRVEAAICLVCWNPKDASFPTKVEEKTSRRSHLHFLDGRGEQATTSPSSCSNNKD